MLEKVLAILTSYGYKIDYSSYHTDDDIKKYSDKRDHVSKDKFFTVYTPEGYVVGRLHQLKKGKTFTFEHLATVIGYFEIFEVTDCDRILKELKNLFAKDTSIKEK